MLAAALTALERVDSINGMANPLTIGVALRDRPFCPLCVLAVILKGRGRRLRREDVSHCALRDGDELVVEDSDSEVPSRRPNEERAELPPSAHPWVAVPSRSGSWNTPNSGKGATGSELKPGRRSPCCRVRFVTCSVWFEATASNSSTPAIFDAWSNVIVT